MVIERARSQVVPKPWGGTDLRPWNGYHGESRIGEIWFQRANADAPESALLLKVLFTTEPLSIQVHPDDFYARSVGLAHGKSEAWYVLSAKPRGEIALGLKHSLSQSGLRAAIDDGSISELICWRGVKGGDFVFVSPGMIHTIGPGLVILEVQQRSDATFRLYDYGRQRELHTDKAVAAADAEQLEHQASFRRLTTARMLLVASPHFVIERVELPAASCWELQANAEMWLFVLEGTVVVGGVDLGVGEAAYVESERVRLCVGSGELKVLVAYTGSYPIPILLQCLQAWRATPAPKERKRAAPSSRALPNATIPQADA